MPKNRMPKPFSDFTVAELIKAIGDFREEVADYKQQGDKVKERQAQRDLNNARTELRKRT